VRNRSDGEIAYRVQAIVFFVNTGVPTGYADKDTFREMCRALDPRFVQPPGQCFAKLF